MEETIIVMVTPNPMARRLCTFIINLDGGWISTVKFPSTRRWVHDLFLKVVFTFGRVEGISYGEENPYPPNIIFRFPKERLKILNALRFIKARDKEKVTRLWEEQDIEKFENEVMVLGIAESIGKSGFSKQTPWR